MKFSLGQGHTTWAGRTVAFYSIPIGLLMLWSAIERTAVVQPAVLLWAAFLVAFTVVALRTAHRWQERLNIWLNLPGGLAGIAFAATIMPQRIPLAFTAALFFAASTVALVWPDKPTHQA
jgi:hypothetical protein